MAMLAGMWVWDEHGNVLVDTTTKMGRIVGSQVIGQGTTGVISSAEFLKGEIFYLLYSMGVARIELPAIVNTGDALNYSGSSAGDFFIFYGVY